MAIFLIILGFFLSPSNPNILIADVAFINRLFALFGVLFCSLMILKINHKQNQIIKLNNNLEEKVKLRTAKLTELLAKETELNEMKSNFISMASHELRTPLAAINSSASIIEMYNANEKDEKLIKHINRIYSNVKNLSDILNNFLSLGKIESGKITIGHSLINLPEFINEVVDELDVLANKKNQRIIYKHRGDLVIDNSDELLRNILINLISNAIKYSQENTEIIVTSFIENKNVTLTVQDHGIGIPEKDQSKLFTPFFRASNTKSIQGTGIGLNIVKQYLEMMNGQISFESKNNEGATFNIEFPQYLILSSEI